MIASGPWGHLTFLLNDGQPSSDRVFAGLTRQQALYYKLENTMLSSRPPSPHLSPLTSYHTPLPPPPPLITPPPSLPHLSPSHPSLPTSSHHAPSLPPPLITHPLPPHLHPSPLSPRLSTRSDSTKCGPPPWLSPPLPPPTPSSLSTLPSESYLTAPRQGRGVCGVTGKLPQSSNS